MQHTITLTKNDLKTLKKKESLICELDDEFVIDGEVFTITLKYIEKVEYDF